VTVGRLITLEEFIQLHSEKFDGDILKMAMVWNGLHGPNMFLMPNTHGICWSNSQTSSFTDSDDEAYGRETPSITPVVSADTDWDEQLEEVQQADFTKHFRVIMYL